MKPALVPAVYLALAIVDGSIPLLLPCLQAAVFFLCPRSSLFVFTSFLRAFLSVLFHLDCGSLLETTAAPSLTKNLLHSIPLFQLFVHLIPLSASHSSPLILFAVVDVSLPPIERLNDIWRQHSR